ncbi:acyltransferase family protein [[Mycobacterium] fortunisiensis]|uniref:acyltransferase family protein n=1 Tax=[Mycobacterium] fortunisiensis TaxID=2600579 RepID=UPI001C26C53E
MREQPRIGAKLGKVFDPRNNALNAWRLVLLTGVILAHSWPLTGRRIEFEPAHQLLANVWLDGFFAISGFLVTRAWFRNPRLGEFLLSRALRLLPGFWVCLIVTAFVIAPISLAVQGDSPVKLLFSREPFLYVLQNSAMLIVKFDVAGTPLDIPWPGQWDGSLWTLTFVVMCYIGTAVLGATGLLSRRWLIPTLFVLTLWWAASLPPLNDVVEQPPGAQPVDTATAMLVVQQVSARLYLMYLTGALLYQLRSRIPARWSLVALSVVVVLASSLLPNYHIVGAIPLAYAVIVSGALARQGWLTLRTDLSYGVYVYAWPMQQLLIVCGLGVLNPVVFSAVAVTVTLPLAALSWFAVEKRALRLKSRFPRRRLPGEAQASAY